MSCANCKQNFPKKPGNGGYYRYSFNIKCAGSDITVGEALEKVSGATLEGCVEVEIYTERSNEKVQECTIQDEPSSSSQIDQGNITLQSTIMAGEVKQNERRQSSRKRKIPPEFSTVFSELNLSNQNKKAAYSSQSDSKSCNEENLVEIRKIHFEKEKRKRPLYFLCYNCYAHLSDIIKHEKALADFWGRHKEDSYLGERLGVYAAESLDHIDHSYAVEKEQLPKYTPCVNDLKIPNYEAKRPKHTSPIKKVKNLPNYKSKKPWKIKSRKNDKWDTLITAIRARQYRRAAKKFYSATKGSRKGFLIVVGIVARREIQKLIKQETKFSLCSPTEVPDSEAFWDKTLDQLKNEAPLLYRVFSTSVTSLGTESTLQRGNRSLKPMLGVTLTSLMYTRAPRKLNSVAKYVCANFWQKRLRGELERKPIRGNQSLCELYSRNEVLKIRNELLTAEKITRQHLEEAIIENRTSIENKTTTGGEDSDSDTIDSAHYHKMAALTEVASNKMFDGLQKVFSHESKECKCTMKFGVYLPPQAEKQKCPVLYWLSGLTCTEQNFVTKAGAQRVAAEKGLIIVAPDTSPRGMEIEGQDDSYDFGSGAGFYVDATEEKWKTNYRMYSYITSELPDLINSNFNTIPDKMSIFGHSMGGHGALICAMKNPGKYKSVSAFAPISNPIKAPWGIKAFTGYLGADQSKWQEYDATELSKKYNGPPLNILIDQGKSDNFYVDKQLLPENLVDACKSNKVALRIQEGYDHSYFFIATFVEDHINHHASFLCQ